MSLPFQLSHYSFNKSIQKIYPTILRIRLIELVDQYDLLLRNHRPTLFLEKIFSKIKRFIEYFNSKTTSVELLHKYGLWICIYGEALLNKIAQYVKVDNSYVDSLIFLSEFDSFNDNLAKLINNILIFIPRQNVTQKEYILIHDVINNLITYYPFYPISLTLSEFSYLKEIVDYLNKIINLSISISLNIDISFLLKEFYHFNYHLKKAC